MSDLQAAIDEIQALADHDNKILQSAELQKIRDAARILEEDADFGVVLQPTAALKLSRWLRETVGNVPYVGIDEEALGFVEAFLRSSRPL